MGHERMRMSPRDLQDEFDQRGPWVTCFKVDGKYYGGKYDAAHDCRLTEFFKHFPNPKRVLELGSLEGGHTFALASRASEVVAIESRSVNLARAKWVQSLLGVPSATFHQMNLDQDELAHLGTFDVIYNVGLLYHLVRPWDLLEKLARLSGAMFLWTHYANDAKFTAGEKKYQGIRYQEFGHSDPLSGMAEYSFWPTLEELKRMLGDAGFVESEIVATENHPHGPAALLVCWTADKRPLDVASATRRVFADTVRLEPVLR